jgi:transcriptional regulator with XRE-family HTH domain
MRSMHSPVYRQLISRLVSARRAAGLTQVEVAQALNMPQSRISRIESGERRVDVVELLELAELYRKPIGYFVGRRRC